MPTLQAEPTVFPNDLFESNASSLTVAQRSWWVLQTKPKQEKAVAREHLGRSLPFFLPTTRRSRMGRRGEVSSYIPLFTGYVFGFLAESERFELNRTGRLASFLPVADQTRFWEELSNLYRLLSLDLEVHPVLQIKEGSLVTIRRGRMKGIEGVVERCSGRCRFIVRIDFLQKGASVEIDEGDLELVSDESVGTAC